MTNTYRYLPDTEQDKKEMLDFLGLSSIDQLFEDIPAKSSFKRRARPSSCRSRTCSVEKNE